MGVGGVWRAVTCCPHCGGTGILAQVDAGEILSWLRRECRKQGIAITFDDAVSSKDAVRLMQAFCGQGSDSYLANDRAGAGLIPYLKRANGRTLYPLVGFAGFLASRT